MTYTTSELPLHLRQYVATQDYDLYSFIDHASWRYIMRVSTSFFKDHAHPKYLDGLEKTGVTIEAIPRISEMDEKLKQIGWRAVIVTGFIPPEPFLELLALRILPIAADMRKLENIDYTPAPDIVHEAAGHAPILADPAYSSYLKKFGEIARKVIFAKEDNNLYEAVLNLSETKENPQATEEEILQAQHQLDRAVEEVGYVSEAQQVTRLGWWSTEYGLFEQNGKFLIYGAGLLSSVGESYHCLSEKIRKVPLTIDCIETSYDITKPQPQLFVTDDFKKLEKVIEQLAEKMAYKHGGVEGLAKAKRAGTVTTTEFDSGVQVSGILRDYQFDSSGKLIFIKWEGPSQLSHQEKELEGHHAQYHGHGFSSPLGAIRGLSKPPWLVDRDEWNSLGCHQGQKCRLEFDSGITVDGIFLSRLKKAEKTLILSFSDCTVKRGAEVLFQPEWGTFDMILGAKPVSVFGGAADRDAYATKIQKKKFQPRPQKCNLLPETRILADLYGQVRKIRESGLLKDQDVLLLAEIKKRLDKDYEDDWLLRLEILELLSPKKLRHDLTEALHRDLKKLAARSERLSMLVGRGLALVGF